jgi:hypothetical protein
VQPLEARLLVELCFKVACYHPGRAGQNLHQSTAKTLAECNRSEPWLTVEISVKVKFPTFFASEHYQDVGRMQLLGSGITSGT